MKKAYTLLEILIVVIIFALMIGVFGFYLPNRDDEQIKLGKEGSNQIYIEINSSYNKLKKGYQEYFSGELKKIKSINIQGSTHITPTSSMIGRTGLQENYEDNNSIQKKLKFQNNKYIFSISGSINLNIDDELSNAEIDILSCINQNSGPCIPISKILFNQATQKIEQKFCLNFTGSTCNQWEQ